LTVTDDFPFRKQFSGHESFSLRYPWLKKGYEEICKDSGAFSADDAVVRLGVGKNMVQSIRYWCLATRMLRSESSSHGRVLFPSDLGSRLLGDTGWDPYVEDEGTAWLLHWNLCSVGTWTPTWYWAFNFLPSTALSQPSLVALMSDWVRALGWADVAASTKKRDLECMIHCYCARRIGSRAALESISCPLQGLGLVEWDASSGLLRWPTGNKPSLPLAVFIYALCEYWWKTQPHRLSLDIQEICLAEGSPGRVFRLDEDSVLNYVSQIAAVAANSLSLERTPLVNRVVAKKAVKQSLGISILSAYYAN
jgi:hypothetical protein